MWIDIRDPHKPSRILFRYDPGRRLVEVASRGRAVIIDLQQYGELTAAGCGAYNPPDSLPATMP